eukprot:10199522-Heterocapsa_arctica.AAC.1
MDRLFVGALTPAMASAEIKSPPPELTENIKDKQGIAEWEALLRRPRSEHTAVSTTPRFRQTLWRHVFRDALRKCCADNGCARISYCAAHRSDNSSAHWRATWPGMVCAAEVTDPDPVSGPRLRPTIARVTLSSQTLVFRS